MLSVGMERRGQLQNQSKAKSRGDGEKRKVRKLAPVFHLG